MGASRSKWCMCIFSPSWEEIEICIKIQQWKDIQEDYQQIRDFNRVLEEKKNQEIAAIKTGKSKAYKIPELAAKEPVYQWSSYRLEHNRMVKAEKEKGIRFQMPTSRSRTPNCKTFIYKTWRCSSKECKWIVFGKPSNCTDTAAAAKSLQSCLTLCDSIDGSPPGSPVPGILQARTLEWVAISFSNAWKWKVKVKSVMSDF